MLRTVAAKMAWVGRTRRTLMLVGSMALVGALWGALLLTSGMGLQAAEAQTTTPSSGTVVAWGYNVNGQVNVPADLGSVKAIDAGPQSSLALKDDGTPVAWGASTPVPAQAQGDVKAVSAGGEHNLALKNDGTVVA